MILFFIGFFAIFGITLLIQLISKIKIVGGNELGIVSGRGARKGFTTVSGGRVFILPFINRFYKIDLTPHTVEIMVDSAIAAGVVPLNVKATVSFAIASNDAGRSHAVTRALGMNANKDLLTRTASSIIEGHLRDAIASMTPEQVMQDKDTLVARMINVCKSDLENIGLEITTMNIADVDDHRLPGVEEPDLYIALLKRIQTANAQTQARAAQAQADASSTEEREARRADVQVRTCENQYENLLAQTRVRVAAENQRKAVGIEKAKQSATAETAGMKAKIEAEKQRIEMLKKKFEAEVITPTAAQKEKAILEAQADSAKLLGKAQAEIDQLKKTLSILASKNDLGKQAFLIENFESVIRPFAETLALFPAQRLSIITGAEGNHEPISAIHPNAIELEKNRLIQGAIAKALGLEEQPAERKVAEEKNAPRKSPEEPQSRLKRRS
jgi:flotillin